MQAATLVATLTAARAALPGVSLRDVARAALLMGMIVVLTAAAGAAMSAEPVAKDPPACRQVRMADPGWTDVAATNALTGIVLTALGYEQTIATLSVPITYVGMQKQQVDVFLGNWMPAQQALAGPLIAAGKIDRLRANLASARFTLAVPEYVAAAGVQTFADLARHADRFDSTIYGIEPGSPANQNIRRMLDDRAYGLRDWTLVESSEQSMLSQVARKERKRQWVVFLAWEPHQMNKRFKLRYLGGDSSYFGANFGNTTVNTVARRGFAAQCPNLGRLFGQIAFDVDTENRIMGEILEHKANAQTAARRELQTQPALLAAWLDGVHTFDGADGLPAVNDMLRQP
jgi:glycine betaine/proline transport system substrate-binding protein